MGTQNYSDNGQVNQLITKLNRLASIDLSAIERIARAVDEELTKAGASARSLSQAQRDMCANVGSNPDQFAAFQAKQAADARIVASIPHDSLVILKVLVGDDNSKIAARWTETQRQIADGRIAR